MPDVKTKFIKGGTSGINNTPLKDGQILFDQDLSKIYIDTYKDNVLTRVLMTKNSSGGGDAEDITYNNTISELEAEDVQAAIDEVVTILDEKVDAANLGTAAEKNVATSGDAGSTEVVMGNDTRLSDARPASDVSSWAKAATKPSYTAAEVGAIPATDKGSNNGVAELDSTGKVPSSQLPSFVDDVLEFTSLSAFPAVGETGKIYVALDTNKTYRWSGSVYVETNPSLALGETSSTAYRGDRGKTAYDHSQTTSGNPHNVTKSDVGLGNVGNFKAVSTVASQGLTDTEKSNARANIGAGTSSLALGTSSSTAYRGDRGNAAYAHAVTNKGAAFESGLYKITTNSEGHVTAATAVAKDDITGLGIPGSDTNTHRPIQVNGEEVLGNNTTALNLKAGSNVSVTNSSGTVTIAATNTTYGVVSTSANGLAPKVTDTSKYLKGDGTWDTPTNTDTKNTAGSTDTSSKIFLIGATSQAANPQTYSHDTAYVGTDGCLYSGGSKVLTAHDGNNRRSFYGTCDTAAATAAKVITLSDTTGWELKAGTMIAVKFTATNSASNVTLNVNGSGAKSIYYGNAVYTSTSSAVCGYANRTNLYIYDGTYWVWLSHGVDDNTTYSAMSTSELTTGTATTSRVVRSDYLKAGINSLIEAKGYTTNTGTVTKVSTGAGLTGGDVTTSGTIKADLKSETKSSLTAASKGSTSSREYAVGLDSAGDLSVNIPWTDTNTHRPIQMNGTEILGNNTTALNLKAGSNVSLSNSSGTVTITATDTTALTAMTGTLALGHGGTGGTSAKEARANLVATRIYYGSTDPYSSCNNGDIWIA